MGDESVNIVEASDLSKRYSPKRPLAVDSLSLHLKAGEIFGFVGPNGAGKTTTIKMLMGMVLPDSGGGSILGMDILKDSVNIRKRVGFMSGEVKLYNHMKGLEVLAMTQRLHGGGNEKLLKKLIEQFDVPLNRKIKTFSAGQKQQLALIAALSHDSDLLVLDEPTKGLDPSKKKDFLDIIEKRGQQGAGVIISSHVLSEIESICTRVGFIREGILLGHNEIEHVREKLSDLIVVSFEREIDIASLKKIPEVEKIVEKGHEYIIHLKGEGGAVIKQLADLPLKSLRYRQASLDDLYENLYLNNESHESETDENDDRDPYSGLYAGSGRDRQ